MCVRVAFSIKGAWNMATLIQISYKIYIHQRVVPNEGGGREKQHTHSHTVGGVKNLTFCTWSGTRTGHTRGQGTVLSEGLHNLWRHR